MSKLPSVPKQNRSPKGPGDDPRRKQDSTGAKPQPENLREQDRQGNIAQNTTNQGYQQDR